MLLRGLSGFRPFSEARGRNPLFKGTQPFTCSAKKKNKDKKDEVHDEKSPKESSKDSREEGQKHNSFVQA